METTFLGESFWGIAKIAVLVCILLYIVFAVVIIRQVRLMTETLDVGFEKAIRLAALIHLISSLALFLLATFIL